MKKEIEVVATKFSDIFLNLPIIDVLVALGMLALLNVFEMQSNAFRDSLEISGVLYNEWIVTWTTLVVKVSAYCLLLISLLKVIKLVSRKDA